MDVVLSLRSLVEHVDCAPCVRTPARLHKVQSLRHAGKGPRGLEAAVLRSEPGQLLSLLDARRGCRLAQLLVHRSLCQLDQTVMLVGSRGREVRISSDPAALRDLP